MTNKRSPKRDAKSRCLSVMKAAISLTKIKILTPRALTELPSPSCAPTAGSRQGGRCGESLGAVIESVRVRRTSHARTEVCLQGSRTGWNPPIPWILKAHFSPCVAQKPSFRKDWLGACVATQLAESRPPFSHTVTIDRFVTISALSSPASSVGCYGGSRCRAELLFELKISPSTSLWHVVAGEEPGAEHQPC